MILSYNDIDDSSLFSYLIEQFASHYHEDSNNCYEYITRHKNGQTAFSSFVKKNYNVTLLPYQLKYDEPSGYTDIFSQGFEIEEDEALTALLLKAEKNG